MITLAWTILKVHCSTGSKPPANAASAWSTKTDTNFCEESSFSELEWARKIAEEMRWNGDFLALPLNARHSIC